MGNEDKKSRKMQEETRRNQEIQGNSSVYSGKREEEMRRNFKYILIRGGEVFIVLNDIR